MPWAAVSVLHARPAEPVAGDVLVVSWEWLVRHRGMLPPLRAIIADEAHYAKDLAAKRTRSLLTAAKNLPADGMLVGLTGTPVVSGHVDLVPMLRACNAFGAFGGEASFRARYCPEYEIENVGPKKVTLVRHRSLHGREMNQRLVDSNTMLRRRKAEVLDELPAKRIGYRVIELPPGEAHSVLSRALEADEHFVDTAEDDAAGGMPANRMPQEIGLISNLRRLTEVAKVPMACDWAEQWLKGRPNEKLVIFAGHREASRALGEHFGVLPLIGGVPASKRSEVVSRFMEDPDERVLVASHAAMGVGINLQAATGVLFLEQPWTPAACEQAEDRCHRIGQRSVVEVTYLIAMGTIDEPVSRLLDRKTTIVRRATEPNSDHAMPVRSTKEVSGQQVLSAVTAWIGEHTRELAAA